MPHQLSNPERRTALKALRVMFPHDELPDAPYERVVGKLEAAASGDADAARRLDESLEQPHDGDRFADLAEEACVARLKPLAGTPFFELLRGTTVVELYDDPEVWRFLGYEGASVHLGGYLDRGFNDPDWLPDPPLAMDAGAGSHHPQ